MKNLSLLVWLSQLGLSVALPPVGFIWLATWLCDRFALGKWVIWVGIVLGILCAISGLCNSLRSMQLLAGEQKDPSGVAFNDHE